MISRARAGLLALASIILALAQNPAAGAARGPTAPHSVPAPVGRGIVLHTHCSAPDASGHVSVSAWLDVPQGLTRSILDVAYRTAARNGPGAPACEYAVERPPCGPDSRFPFHRELRVGVSLSVTVTLDAGHGRTATTELVASPEDTVRASTGDVHEPSRDTLSTTGSVIGAQEDLE